MVYKNTVTGAIIDSPCIISGGDWVISEPEEKPKRRATKKKEDSEATE